MSIAESFVPGGQDRRHLVQFYGSDFTELVENVAAYIAEGVRDGSAALVVATPEHTDAILGALPASSDEAARAIVCLDAQATLDRFMVGGQPDWRLFEQSVGGIVRTLRRGAPGGSLRVYGEMVGLLWQAGALEAAVCLEKFWNVLLADDEFSLYCGYPVDVAAGDFRRAGAGELLCTHTHVLCGTANRETAGALDATMQWLRRHGPDAAGDILSRARSFYRECA
ncbi:MAG TPA: MEDS domain-containing protein [Candidatus Elarobacter sp.]